MKGIARLRGDWLIVPLLANRATRKSKFDQPFLLSATMITAKQTALWVPGWYELDQTLTLGEMQKLWFFQTPPEAILHEGVGIGEATPDYVFFNQLDSTTNCQIRFARVTEMIHPQIGPLTRIDTDGCDYLFFPVDGEEIVVNAEENPGQSYDEDLNVSDWAVHVMIEDVSDPIIDSV